MNFTQLCLFIIVIGMFVMVPPLLPIVIALAVLWYGFQFITVGFILAFDKLTGK